MDFAKFKVRVHVGPWITYSGRSLTSAAGVSALGQPSLAAELLAWLGLLLNQTKLELGIWSPNQREATCGWSQMQR